MRKFIRPIVAVVGIGFAVFVALQFRRPAPVKAVPPVPRVDPGAMGEMLGAVLQWFKSSHEDATIKAKRQLLYADGSMKLFEVSVTTEERGKGKRTFTVTADEAQLGADNSNVTLHGHVRLAASDGLAATTEDASYSKADRVVRADGPMQFENGRISGSGTGMTYDEANDILVLAASAIVHVGPDKKGEGAADVNAGHATFARREKFVRFEGGVHVERPAQKIDADLAVGRLTGDGDHIETIELRGNARVAAANAAAGSLESLTGRDMDLKYGVSGETIEHAHIDGQAVLKLAGEAKKPGREIDAETLDISLAPDGSTPTALTGRGQVVLTFPAEQGTGARTIKAASLDAKGAAGRGLTRAVFTGEVRYQEQAKDGDREARAATLDVGLKQGLSTIEDAKFAHNVRFEQGTLTALAAAARYDPEKGTLELRGSEPTSPAPHAENDQINVDAATIDVTLEGPKLSAKGTPVKTVIKPPDKKDKQNTKDTKDTKESKEAKTKMPAMLKQDQPVTVLAQSLEYDGTASQSTYTGGVLLFQGDTSIKAPSIVLDDKKGDVTATGGVTTTTRLEQTNEKDKKTERVTSIGTSKDFKYEDEPRRLTYTGEAHLTGPQGDMTAARIELYLKESGDELDRAEAYETLTLKEQNRTTTGSRMTYTTKDDKYVVVGVPVEIVDECGRKTTGNTLTFVKATDTIVVDGNDRIRTQSKSGGGKCP